MTTEKYLALGKRTALISFLLGTLIFVLYYLTSSSDLLFFGYAFIAITGLINIIILIIILARAKKENNNKAKFLRTSGLMLLNIPVMLVYCWLALNLTGIMRITFTNSTGSELTDIKITGCEQEHIDKLAPGQSKNVWINITGDCAIFIDYLVAGQTKQEIVVGYVTGGMGTKMKYKISGKNQPF